MIKAGKYSYGSPIFAPYNKCNVTIGDFTGFAENVSIDTGGEHDTACVTTFPFHHFDCFRKHVEGVPRNSEYAKGDIVIGNDVWIGEGVRILTATTIGDGAVIGSRAVVAGYIPPYAIAVGVPARVIKYRFRPDVIEKLLKVQWWNWPIEKILANAKILVSHDIEALFKVAGV